MAVRKCARAGVIAVAMLAGAACESRSDGPKGVFELPVDDVAAFAGSTSGAPAAGVGGAGAGVGTGGGSAGDPSTASGTGGIPLGAGGGSGSGVGGTGGTAVGGSGGSAGVAGDPGVPPPPATRTPLPCDVAAVLRGSCIACHANPPLSGAPMPLLTWEDLDAPARTAPTRKVRDLVVERISSGLRPMPPRPNPTLSADSIAVVTNWVGAGGPPGSDPACLLP